MNDDVAGRRVAGALGRAFFFARAEPLFAIDGSGVLAVGLGLFALAAEIGLLLFLDVVGVHLRERFRAVGPHRSPAVDVVIAVLRFVHDVERLDLQLGAVFFLPACSRSPRSRWWREP